ncbi:DMT family transporter [Jannaschia sp. CCS1]|uniref:DMT family transporter n=1 Tax=Jannaschia sp. (strain CCS1) TaxID=290400 RepID=UPI000053ADD1|nr:multidrug efflux SMR transporter [Jannaschia sp. CCS1]ABD55988.1 small multidrug resistance protein [Jannaschia sp. CCS1]
MAWLYLVFAILAEVIATSALKASEGFTQGPAAAMTVVGYAVSFYFLGLAFRTIPLGVAYAVWAGVGIVTVTLIGVYWFNQPIGAGQAAGIAMILGGVLILRLMTTTA